jgi:hypothetical protein
MMSMMPNTRVSPAAIRNSISPNCRPFNNCSKSSVHVIHTPPAAGAEARARSTNHPALKIKIKACRAQAGRGGGAYILQSLT